MYCVPKKFKNDFKNEDWCTNSDATDTYGNITTWCVGDVTSMASLFDADEDSNRASLNDDIGCWDVLESLLDKVSERSG